MKGPLGCWYMHENVMKCPLGCHYMQGNVIKCPPDCYDMQENVMRCPLGCFCVENVSCIALCGYLHARMIMKCSGALLVKNT